MPDERHEAMRDLSRAREAARKDLKGKRQQVSSFMLRLLDCGSIVVERPTISHDTGRDRVRGAAGAVAPPIAGGSADKGFGQSGTILAMAIAHSPLCCPISRTGILGSAQG
jgi:hypothetical protein